MTKWPGTYFWVMTPTLVCNNSDALLIKHAVLHLTNLTFTSQKSYPLDLLSEIPQKSLWIDYGVISACISWEFDKHLSEIMISRLWLDMSIICKAIYHLVFKSMHCFCHVWLPVITKQDISTRKCTSRDADLKVQVPSFQVVKGHLLQTCSFQLWEALDGNRLKPHALPQHGGPRMVTLRKRKTEKESRSETANALLSVSAGLFAEVGCGPAQGILVMILKGSWFICVWSELEFCSKAYRQEQDLPCWNWYTAVKVLLHTSYKPTIKYCAAKTWVKRCEITHNSP